ncbi:hypothetical protein [Vibrio phage vB_VruC_PG21]|uniref:Uncharacterized protein n=1 Tax=Vibrio phage vB_VruC_PG21 TaxID=2928757 RepID=A0AAE9GSB9_9VIRU|nr:hypothetical protein [Vibrio sp. CK2-1]MCF7355078.1 hypothetical protein [Vibrio sp. CK2-1]UOL48284.1 hypothetical protein [Vibrio phage vB_VruC_PG21]
MGGSSSSANKSSTSTTTVNKNTSVGLNDELNGNFVQGLENSTVNITDGGAVNKALEAIAMNNKEAFSFGGEALGVNEAVTKAALSTSENYLDSALNFGSQSLGDILDFGRDAITASEVATGSALDVAKNLSLDSDAATARDTNKNMMYSTLAIAVALAFVAAKK